MAGRWRSRRSARVLAAVGVVLVGLLIAPAVGLVLLVLILTVAGVRIRAAHERRRQPAPDLRRADDTTAGGDVRDVGFADKIFLGGDGV